MRATFLGSVLALALSAAGCASPGPSGDQASIEAAASATAARGGGPSIFDIPAMRSGRAHRERGAEAMRSAYAQRDTIQREGGFHTAWVEFKAAEDDYHAALVVAQPRFRPVIDNEIQKVGEYMKQIRRDRESLEPVEPKKPADEQASATR